MSRHDMAVKLAEVALMAGAAGFERGLHRRGGVWTGILGSRPRRDLHRLRPHYRRNHLGSSMSAVRYCREAM